MHRIELKSGRYNKIFLRRRIIQRIQFKGGRYITDLSRRRIMHGIELKSGRYITYFPAESCTEWILKSGRYMTHLSRRRSPNQLKSGRYTTDLLWRLRVALGMSPLFLERGTRPQYPPRPSYHTTPRNRTRQVKRPRVRVHVARRKPATRACEINSEAFVRYYGLMCSRR